MISFTTLIGLLAAFFTTVSYVPQLKKCWATGSAEDLSLKMFLILAAGISLWVVYGLLQKDPVIVLANSVSLRSPRENSCGRRRRFIRARRRQGVPRSKIAFIFMTEPSHGGAIRPPK
jgi:uncharacterized protein with PQ loop repeat